MIFAIFLLGGPAWRLWSLQQAPALNLSFLSTPFLYTSCCHTYNKRGAAYYFLYEIGTHSPTSIPLQPPHLEWWRKPPTWVGTSYCVRQGKRSRNGSSTQPQQCKTKKVHDGYLHGTMLACCIQLTQGYPSYLRHHICELSVTAKT